jgi:hypothetical protein
MTRTLRLQINNVTQTRRYLFAQCPTARGASDKYLDELRVETSSFTKVQFPVRVALNVCRGRYADAT